MTEPDSIFEVVDPSGLVPGDLEALEALRKAHRDGGVGALDKAMGELTQRDPGCMLRIMAAVYSDM